jgi:peroxin-2
MSDEKPPVLRVTQLDTNELNNSLLTSLKHSLNEELFKYINLNILQRYRVEIFAAVKFVIWYHTFGKNGQTIGQMLLDWTYSNSSTNTKLLLTKKIIHAIIYCLDEWFEERFFLILKKILLTIYLFKKKKNTNRNDQTTEPTSSASTTVETATFEKKFHQITNFLFQFYKSLSFVNFLVFLYNGKYLHLWERLLRWRPIYNKAQFMSTSNSVSEASIREEMWYAYFSLFKMSNNLVNISSVYNKFIQNLFKSNKTRLAITKNKNQFDQINTSVCGICGEAPVMAHKSVNEKEDDFQICKHIYCYQCVRTAILDSHKARYECFLCNASIKEIELFFKN